MSQSQDFNSISSRNIVIDEFNTESVLISLQNKLNGLYIVPSQGVPGRTDITNYVLTSVDSSGKVQWKETSPGQSVDGLGKVWFSDALGNAIGTDNLLWENDSLRIKGVLSLGNLQNDIITMGAPPIINQPYNIVLPPGPGIINQVLTTDGNGILSWTPKGGGGQTVPGQGRLWFSDAIGNPVGANSLVYLGGVLTVDNVIRLSDGTFFFGFQQGVQADDITLVLPTTTGTNGQVLTTDGTGILTWTTPEANPTVVGAGRLWYSDANGDPVGDAGLIYSGGVLTVDDVIRLSNGTFFFGFQQGVQVDDITLVLPTTTGTNGQVLTTDGLGVLSWTTPEANPTVVGAGRIWYSDANGDPVGDAGLIYSGGVLTVDNVIRLDDGTFFFGFQQGVQAGDITLVLPTTTGVNGQVLTTDGTGILTWTTPEEIPTVAGQGRIWYSDANGDPVGDAGLIYSGGVLTVDDTLRLSNGVFFFGFQQGVQVGDITLVLPTTTGNNGQVLTTDGTGVLTWTTPEANPTVVGAGRIWYSDANGDPVGDVGLIYSGGVLTLNNVIRLDDGAFFFGFQQGVQAGDITLVLPTTTGVNGQVLTTDGTGVLTWTTPEANPTVAGTGRVWYSDANGDPVGDAGFVYNGVDLTLDNIDDTARLVVNRLNVNGALSVSNAGVLVTNGGMVAESIDSRTFITCNNVIFRNGNDPFKTTTLRPSNSQSPNSIFLTLPQNIPTTGQVLSAIDTFGNLTWTTPEANPVVVGQGRVWYSDANGDPVGDVGFVFENDRLTVGLGILINQGIYKYSITSSILSEDLFLNLPNTSGVNGQVLTTDGSGLLSWTTPEANPTVVGVGRIWYSDANGDPVGDAGLIYSGGVLTVDNIIRLDNGTFFFGFQQGVQAGDITLVLPTTTGTNGQVLTTDGTGVLSWTNVQGGVTVPGQGRIWYSDANGDPIGDVGLIYSGGVLTVDNVIRLSDGTFFFGFQQGVQAGDITLVLPTTTGANGQVLTTDGTGVLSWTNVQGGVTVPGQGRIWYSDANGDPVGDAGLVYSGGILTVDNVIRLDNGAFFFGFQQGVQAGDITLTLPTTTGANGQVLTTDGLGVLTWTTPEANPTVAGTGRIWYSDANGDPVGDAGLIYSGGVLTVDNVIRLDNGAFFFGFQQGVQVGDITLTLPTTAGINGQVLTTDGTGVLTWTTPNSVLGQGRVWYSDINGDPVGNDGLIYSGSVLTVESVIRISDGAFFFGFQQGVQVGDITLTLPTTTGTNGQVLTTDGTGVLTWTTPESNPTVAGAGRIWYSDANGDPVGDSGLVYSGGVLTVDDVIRLDNGAFFFEFQQGVQSGDITITLPTTTGNNGQVLTTDGLGVLSWTTPEANPTVAGQGRIWYSDANGDPVGDDGLVYLGGILTVDNIIRLDDGAFFFEFQQGVQLENITITLPTTTGANGQVLTTDGLGVLSWTTPDVNPTVAGAGRIWYSDANGDPVGDAGLIYSGGILTVDDVIRLSDGTFFFGFQQGVQVGDITLVLPTTVGANGQVLTTDGTGILTWTTPEANPTVAGQGRIWYSDANGDPVGDVGLIYSGGVLTVDDTLRLSDGTFFFGFQQGVQAGDITLTLPTTAGTNGQVLTTDGTGILTWTTPEANPTVAGTGRIWYSDANGDPVGDAGLVYSGGVLTLNNVLRLSDGTFFFGFQQGVQIADITLTLPTTAGANGQVLTTDGTGVLTWTTPEANPTVAGAGRVWYSDANGDPVGDAGFVYNGVDLTLDNIDDTARLVVNRLNVNGALSVSNAGVLVTSGGMVAESIDSRTFITCNNVIFRNGNDPFKTTTIRPSNSQSPNSIFLTLPQNTPTAGQVLSVIDAFGNLTWTTPEANPTVAGQGLIWFSDANGDPIGNALLVYDNNTNVLTVTNVYVANTLTIDAGSIQGNFVTNITTGEQLEDITLRLPLTPGLSGQVLTTDGTGILTWTTPEANPTVSGTGRIWYSDANGDPVGDAGLIYSGGILTVGPIILNGGTGEITADTYAVISDRRLKRNVVPIPEEMSMVVLDRLNIYEYNLRDSSKKNYGVIAQELESIAELSDMVSTASDGTKSVDYTQLIPLLIGTLKTLNNRIKHLEERT